VVQYFYKKSTYFYPLGFGEDTGVSLRKMRKGKKVGNDLRDITYDLIGCNRDIAYEFLRMINKDKLVPEMEYKYDYLQRMCSELGFNRLGY
jgi:hypothetical protein